MPALDTGLRMFLAKGPRVHIQHLRTHAPTLAHTHPHAHTHTRIRAWTNNRWTMYKELPIFAACFAGFAKGPERGLQNFRLAFQDEGGCGSHRLNHHNALTQRERARERTMSKELRELQHYRGFIVRWCARAIAEDEGASTFKTNFFFFLLIPCRKNIALFRIDCTIFGRLRIHRPTTTPTPTTTTTTTTTTTATAATAIAKTVVTFFVENFKREDERCKNNWQKMLLLLFYRDEQFCFEPSLQKWTDVLTKMFKTIFNCRWLSSEN